MTKRKEKNMSRLIAFGCSHTYGHGLKDCIREEYRPGYNPSNLAWPKILGKKLNLEVINKSKPGASNLEILYHILNFKFDPTDLVIILWSYWNRDMIFTTQVVGANNQMYESILPNLMHGKEENLKNYYFKVHNDRDLQMKTYMHMHHGEVFLEYKKIKNLSFSVEGYKSFPSFATLNNYRDIDFAGIISSHDRALDRTHPGEEAHKKLAEEIGKFLND